MTSPQPLASTRDVRLLLAGQSVTQIGTQVSGIALPLLAVLVLHVTPIGLGVLSAAGGVAVLLLGLPAGALLDRVRKRRVLIASDAVRALLAGSIPAAAALGVLTYGQVLAVTVLAGAARVVFDVGFQSYLPAVLGPERVLRGNSAIEVARTGGQIVGPGLGGVLVTTAGAATAFLVDALSFVGSAVALAAVRTRESMPVHAARPRLGAEIAEGLHLVLRDRVLRALALTSAAANLQFAIASAVNVIFLTRVLGLDGFGVGLLVAVGAGAALLGAALTPRLAAAAGSARIVWLSLAVTAPLSILGAFAQPGLLVVLAVAGGLAGEAGQIVYAITSVSLRQRRCPPEVLSRVNATMRVLVLGLFPVGALLGGVLGEIAGPRVVLLAAGAVGLGCPVVAGLALRGVRTVESLPLMRR